MHPRNRHTGRYDFEHLTALLPKLKPFVAKNPYGDLSIDFANPKAVQALNQALLKSFYGTEFWDIPENYLCPPIPGRADYIHQIADLLAPHFGRKIPQGPQIKILDIGTGASCIYPIIAHGEFGWSVVGSEVDVTAYESAKKIVEKNPELSKVIELRKQTTQDAIFKTVIRKGEYYEASICNPPFHSSQEEANEGSRRKWENLGKFKQIEQATRNFGGHGGELWCPGGEVGFIKRMVQDSSTYQKQVRWFTSLVSKDSSLDAIYSAIHGAKVYDMKTLDMSQGQKKSRIVAWTWMKS